VSNAASISPVISIGQCSRIGLKDRNDDSFGVVLPTEPSMLAQGITMAIADGMSTAEGGKEASESCVKSFLTEFYDTPASWTVKTSARRILDASNRWLHSQCQVQYLSDKDMVTTFSGLVLKGGLAHIFHVGDSRITRMRDNYLEPLTRDHRLQMAGDREYLSRAMGVDINVEIDYRRVEVLEGDIFIFTTDGVHDFTNPRDAVETINLHANDLDKAAEIIVDASLAAGSPDNVTCQIVRIDKVGTRDEDAHHQSLSALPFPPDLAEGMIMDGYRILREIHLSSRSQVYLAVDTDTDEELILKTPSVNFEDDPTYIEQFTREEWIGQWITNPHVARAIIPTRTRAFLYTLFEYVDGPTLRQWMTDNPSPKLDDVRQIIEQIATGLRAMHRMEMIHQDLKPENIIIDRHGTARIVDFGSVRILGIEESTPDGRPSHALGTAGYSAPEVIIDNNATYQSDLYSLATITYEMLTGHLPYGRDLGNAAQIRKAVYQSATRHNPDLPVWIDGALERGTSLSEDSRYSELSEFTTDIKTPNPEFTARKRPLMERDPVTFWKVISAILAGLLILSMAI